MCGPYLLGFFMCKHGVDRRGDGLHQGGLQMKRKDAESLVFHLPLTPDVTPSLCSRSLEEGHCLLKERQGPDN